MLRISPFCCVILIFILFCCAFLFGVRPALQNKNILEILSSNIHPCSAEWQSSNQRIDVGANYKYDEKI